MKIGVSLKKVPDNENAVKALKRFTSATIDTPKYGEKIPEFEGKYQWAKMNLSSIRGNCLLYFPESSHLWLDGITELAIQEYVQSTVCAYPGIGYWDVVNEIVGDSGCLRIKTKPYCLNNRIMHPVCLIPHWVKKMFIWASEANPRADYFINDYRPQNKTKWDAILMLVEDIKSQGIRVDGIGIQIHHHLPRACSEGFFAWKSIREIVRAAKNLELKVHFTEVSIWSPSSIGTALAYRQIVQLAKDEGVENVTFWSLSDHPDDHWGFDENAKGAGVYNGNYQLKLGMDEIFQTSV